MRMVISHPLTYCHRYIFYTLFVHGFTYIHLYKLQLSGGSTRDSNRALATQKKRLDRLRYGAGEQLQQSSSDRCTLQFLEQQQKELVCLCGDV